MSLAHLRTHSGLVQTAERPQPPRARTFGFSSARFLCGFLCGLVAIGTPLASPAATYEPSGIVPPAPVREFRAAWVATVANIDWPSRKTLSTQEQKAELLAILDRAAQLKLNAIIFQVRPACDALYASRIEPLSEYLSGTMGKPPEPFYDPLAFAIEEAHKRGLELHAWLNPYRARLLTGKSPAARRTCSGCRSGEQPIRVCAYFGHASCGFEGPIEVLREGLAVALPARLLDVG